MRLIILALIITMSASCKQEAEEILVVNNLVGPDPLLYECGKETHFLDHGDVSFCKDDWGVMIRNGHNKRYFSSGACKKNEITQLSVEFCEEDEHCIDQGNIRVEKKCVPLKIEILADNIPFTEEIEEEIDEETARDLNLILFDLGNYVENRWDHDTPEARIVAVESLLKELAILYSSGELDNEEIKTLVTTELHYLFPNESPMFEIVLKYFPNLQ